MAVAFLLEQVTGVTRGYADLISGGDKEFKKLRDDVDQLNDILKDLPDTSSEDKTVRLIKNQMLEAVYEAEDVIDSWLTELNARYRITRRFTNLIFAKKVMFLREHKVKKMLEKAKEMKTFLQSATTSHEAQDHERRTDTPIRQEKVVGLEDEKEKIKGYLMKDQPELDIIPVIGMPGLGKTTLTWKIYNDEKIHYEFPIRIWVHFSWRFNAKDVLIQIMNHFTANMEELYIKSELELCSIVHACLSREKFLLVVDDVWKTEHWDAIKYALPYENGKGKVIITSRELRVGRHVKHITEIHEQRPLNRLESWELLQLEVFGNIGGCPDVLEGFGDAIAEKCKGIPLTIVVMGGVLKDQYLSLKSEALLKEKWEELAKNDNLEAVLKDKTQVISDVVASSYDILPDYLKDCFLYLGVFPAGYDIPAWTLTRLWIAEGFVQPDGKRSLEKIAEDYLNDLIKRNLLMVHKMSPMQEVKVCRVHDVIRIFCKNEAEKQRLFKEVRMTDASDIEKIHRLCIHSDLDRFFSEKPRGPRVRSFLSFRKDAIGLEPQNVAVIYKNFESLRILHSQSIKVNEFDPKLFKLIHLRYIVLCVPDLTLLPEQISQLWNLQTIVVVTNSNSITTKANIWKMMRLRHVKTKAAIVLDKRHVEGGSAKNLHTLNRLSPESVTAAISRNARYLNTLGIRGELAPLFDDMSLEKLNHLEKLKLYHLVESENRLRRFPDCNRFPPNLRRLTLSNTFLDWKHMPTLAMISHLEVLKLKDNAFSGIHWDASSYGFMRLQLLLIVNTDLVLWVAVPNTFPRLRHLVLKNCEKLKVIPECILQHLENLEIDRVRKSIAESVRNSEAQFKRAIGPYVI